MKKRTFYELRTIRSKTMALSKLAGGAIVLFYLVTEGLPVDRKISFWIWFVLLVTVIMTVDFLLGKLISKPLDRINDTAGQMARLDFTAHCDIRTRDEFGELSGSLNTMFSNLQNALDKLEKANARLEKDVEQEKMLLEQRKELTDSLSHEMKTPLGLIRAYAEGLNEEADPGKRQQYIDSILNATERMDHIIVSLLDLSALESGASKLTEERFEFIELVETITGRLILDTPDPAYRFQYGLPNEKIHVTADRQRIEQVLSNLIGNAKKYVLRGGVIRLTVSLDGDILLFSIYNDCASMTEEEIGKIWQKFYRCPDNKHEGSGLGLAIAAQILSMYQADYGARNVDKGVEFFFRFPVLIQNI